MEYSDRLTDAIYRKQYELKCNHPNMRIILSFDFWVALISELKGNINGLSMHATGEVTLEAQFMGHRVSYSKDLIQDILILEGADV